MMGISWGNMLHCWENPPETDYKPESALVSLIGLSSTFCRNCKQQPVQELEHGHIPRSSSYSLCNQIIRPYVRKIVEN